MSAASELPRTGLVAFWKNYDRKNVLRYAQMADELGYDSFWVPEGWAYEAFSLLAEIAIHTRRIKVGTGIVNVFSRSPGLMAMQAATLDEIAEGRLILGLGTSGIRVIEGFHGVPYRKPLTRLRQYIQVVQTLVAGRRLTEAGADLWEFRHFKLEMTPVRPRIPIYCACLNPKAIRMIGELADGWMPTFWPYNRLAEGRALIAQGAAKSGRDPSEVVTAPFTTVIPMPEKQQSYDSARGLISFYIGGMGDYYHQLLSRMGFAENADLVRRLYREGRRQEAAAAVSEELLDALVIAGDPAFCRDRLDEWRAAGVDLPILGLPTDMGPEVCEVFLQLMAPEPA
ncbi:MAG: LLM class flavin-dependent oxidoreductase [Candidatus Dadabacteria bacterium]|nr:MAG: LLM class flavin-dependent oxidoreductase [Candidatus Dadabacteria bacterium]